MRNRFASDKQSGFTLIELLVVIAIISILAAILFPVFASARAKARATACMSNCKQTGLALYQYLQDNDEMVPTVDKTPVPGLDGKGATGTLVYANWYYLLMPYVKNWNLFFCPDDSSRTWQLGVPTPTNDTHTATGNDPYDCYDDLNPTGQCVSYAWNSGFVEDAGSGLYQPYTTDAAGYNVYPGRSISQFISPATMIAFGDGYTKRDGQLACDTLAAYAIPGGGSHFGKSSDLRHNQMLNFVFMDGHAHPIRMVVASNPSYTKNQIVIPANPADALDYCYDPNYTTTYYSGKSGYPLSSAITGAPTSTCSAVVNDVYQHSAILN